MKKKKSFSRNEIAKYSVGWWITDSIYWRPSSCPSLSHQSNTIVDWTQLKKQKIHKNSEAMKLSSTVNANSIQVPCSFDFNLLKSSPVTCNKNVPFRFILRRAYPVSSGILRNRSSIAR